jgi:hypothetical protein
MANRQKMGKRFEPISAALRTRPGIPKLTKIATMREYGEMGVVAISFDIAVCRLCFSISRHLAEADMHSRGRRGSAITDPVRPKSW